MKSMVKSNYDWTESWLWADNRGYIYRISIVEDDSTIMAVLERTLERQNYQVTAVEDFSRVLEQFEKVRLDSVLLDISLPSFGGYCWYGEIRRVSQVPIIFILLTSNDMNLVMAVNMEAGDFLVKPFKLEVVMAKIQALLRRTYAFGEQKTMLRAGGAVLNPGDGTLDVGGRKLELTKSEPRILNMLMERKGTVASRDDMIWQLWEYEDFIDDNTLTVNMTRLRRKLKGVELSGFIETEKGLGYLVSEGGGRVVES